MQSFDPKPKEKTVFETTLQDFARHLQTQVLLSAEEAQLKQRLQLKLGEQAGKMSQQWWQTWGDKALETLWSAPQESVSLLRVAFWVREGQTPPAELMGHALKLSIALNVQGRFAEVAEFLPPYLAAQPDTETKSEARPEARGWVELALAQVYLSQFEPAKTHLLKARSLLEAQEHSATWPYLHWVEGIFQFYQHNYQAAQEAYHQAIQGFDQRAQRLQSSLVQCDLAQVLAYTEATQAVQDSARLRKPQYLSQYPVHQARCDYTQALALAELNKTEQSVARCQAAYRVFRDQKMAFWMAYCQLHFSICYLKQEKYAEARRACEQAKASFIKQNLPSHISQCDFQLGVLEYEQNNYQAALKIFEQVLVLAQAEGKKMRVARAYHNIASCQRYLGNYGPAIKHFNFALEAYQKTKAHLSAGICFQALANTYRRLGRYQQAQRYYQQAYKIFVDEEADHYLVGNKKQQGEFYLRWGQAKQAQLFLQQAHQHYRSADLPTSTAGCNRLLGEVMLALNQPEFALNYLQQAEAVFRAQDLVVEVAICHLLRGRVYLSQDKLDEAEHSLKLSRTTLNAMFPHYAWQVEEALGQCSLQRGLKEEGLKHFCRAADFITTMRESLFIETLNADFVKQHQAVFETVINLALELQDFERALQVVGQSKTQAFLAQSYLRQAEEGAGQDKQAARHAKERHLRREINQLQQQLTPTSIASADPKESPDSAGVALGKLSEKYAAYEAVVHQLWLGQMKEQPAKAMAFSLAGFQAEAQKRLGDDWVCLSYVLLGQNLHIFTIRPQEIALTSRLLNKRDLYIVDQCSNIHHERRTLIYNGTVRGYPVPKPTGPSYLRHLGRLLLPDDLWTQPRPSVLIVAPHGQLHGLPFQALESEQGLLLNYAPLLYVPSLPSLQGLWLRQNQSETPTSGKHLLCGVSDFGERAVRLPHTHSEIEQIAAVLPHAEVLFGPSASTQALNQRNQEGKLAEYETLHFATHALPDPHTPELSRVLLSDDDLTLSGILNLRLQAKLVTLSCCQAAISDVAPGDEITTLARAFLYAQAQSVVASLWPITDESTSHFMGLFYQAYNEGQTVAQALQTAQQTLQQAGYPAYHWAAFIALGEPV